MLNISNQQWDAWHAYAVIESGGKPYRLEGNIDGVLTDRRLPGISFCTACSMAENNRKITVKQSVTNHSGRSLHLISVGISAVCAPMKRSEWVISSIHAKPQTEHAAERETQWDESLALFPKSGGDGLLITPVGTPEAFVKIFTHETEDGLALRVESDMCSILVESGETRAAQDMLWQFGDFDESADFVMDNWAKHLGARTDKPSPSGWCSWYSVFEYVKEQDIFDAAEFFAAHDVKPDFLQLDDGYQVTVGDWWENEKFPSGLSACVDAARRIGARAGVWMAPLIVHENSTVYKDHPEWILKNRDGEPWINMGNWHGPSHSLDATHPEVRAFVKSILQDKLNTGFTYFKLDFNHVYTDGHTSYDPKQTSLQAYRNLYALYREVLGEATYLLSCSGFTRGTMGYADGSRTGGDVVSEWDTTHGFDIHHGLQDNPIKAIANGKIYACDPDVTYVGHAKSPLTVAGLTESERRIWHSFVTLLGGVVQISGLKPEMEENTHQMRISQPPSVETARPVLPCVDLENQRIGFNAHRDFGDSGVYLLWNGADDTVDFETKLVGRLSPLGDRFHVFSFWDGQYMGIKPADFIISHMPRHDLMLLRFTSVKNQPQVVGTTLHIGMGTNEIEYVTLDGNTMTITLNADGADRGDVFIHSERELSLVSAENCKAACERRGEITVVHLSERRETQVIHLTAEV